MSIETDLAAVLGSVAPTYPFGAADQNQRPRITYQRTSGSENEHLDGGGPARVRFQIDVWADDYDTACGLGVNAKVALRAGCTVGEISDNPDDFETDTGLHRRSFDVAVWP